mgnify:CR=1 FL=1
MGRKGLEQTLQVFHKNEVIFSHMLSGMIGLVLFTALVFALGVYAGLAERRELQKTKCPYCSCRSCCSIGFEVDSECKTEDLEPFMCMK